MIHTRPEKTRSFNPLFLVPILLVTTFFACGGGGDSAGLTGGGGGPSNNLAGDFDPSNPSPGANTVSVLGSSSGNVVTLNVTVTGVTDVFGASFDVLYDPTMAEFVNWSVGSALEANNQQVTYQINGQQPGRVVVGVARTTGGGGATVGVTTGLVKLMFQVTQSGTSQVRFERADLLNANDPPTAIGGVGFDGGTLIAN